MDELSTSRLMHIEHTTDSLRVEPERKLPESPQAFDAGRFKITFTKSGKEKTLVIQTESVVGHYTKIVPGEIAIGGYIQIDTEQNNGTVVLEPDEIDYFIKTIYSKFNSPLGEQEAQRLNKLKDYALAILFDSKEKVHTYHLQLLQCLNQKT
ncbi:MAG: hypothetical protein P8Y45_13520 [Exilibacterium sp.]